MFGVDMEIVLVLLFVVPVVILVIFLSQKPRLKQKKLNRLTQAWLLEQHFEKRPNDDHELLELLKQNPATRNGLGRTSVHAAYVSRKDWGTVWVLDFHDINKSPGSSTSSTPSGPTLEHLCLISTQDLNLPEVTVIPSQKLMKSIVGFAAKLHQAIQGSNQNFTLRFTEDPAFADAFLVMSQDEIATRELLSSMVRSFMVELRPLNFYFGCTGQSFALHYGHYIGPEQAQGMLNQGRIFANLFRGETSQAEQMMTQGGHLAG